MTATQPAHATATPTDLNTARADVLALLTDTWVADQVGGHFTCNEADTIAKWIRLELGDTEAEAWLDGHAAGDDDPEDKHGNRATAPKPREFYDNLR